MKYVSILVILLYGLGSCTPAATDSVGTTVCNPVNISYRFCADEPSRREAADPTVLWFRDRYFLFASKSGGYWHSADLTNWTFIESNHIPVEEYAPTVIALEDTLYFLASSNDKSTVYKSADPFSGKWSVAVEQLQMPVWDPAFFLDEDKRLYLYWGCSNVNPLYGVEVDYKNNFSFVGERKELVYPNPEQFGWEVPGDYNAIKGQSPWIEGAWVNKHKGKYYLQYSGPGTEFKSYADAVYVSENPLGPFVIQPHNPFAYKPEGFAAAAGHGSTFQDKYGNYWHIGTSTISQKQMFERRLVLYPAFFDEQNTLYTSTQYGDYPMSIPKQKIKSFEEIFPGWMLLSYKKPVQVSSSVDSLPAANMTDEDIRTYWAAQTGNAGEYAILDLGAEADVYAVQLNLAEHGTKIMGRQKGLVHQYTVEFSNDGKDWTMLIDQSKSETDNTHAYFQLSEKITSRYLKVTNIKLPDGNFAISGFRIFGKGKGELPGKVTELQVNRNQTEKRSVTLSWNKSEGATGYTIRYGVAKDQLYQHYMVYGDTSVTINSLSTQQSAYFFAIEAFNEVGITRSETVIQTTH